MSGSIPAIIAMLYNEVLNIVKGNRDDQELELGDKGFKHHEIRKLNAMGRYVHENLKDHITTSYDENTRQLKAQAKPYDHDAFLWETADHELAVTKLCGRLKKAFYEAGQLRAEPANETMIAAEQCKDMGHNPIYNWNFNILDNGGLPQNPKNVHSDITYGSDFKL